jgi:hypothetical protein
MRSGIVGYGAGGRYVHAPFIEAADGIVLVGIVARSETKSSKQACMWWPISPSPRTPGLRATSPRRRGPALPSTSATTDAATRISSRSPTSWPQDGRDFDAGIHARLVHLGHKLIVGFGVVVEGGRRLLPTERLVVCRRC